MEQQSARRQAAVSKTPTTITTMTFEGDYHGRRQEEAVGADY